ncbi:MAG: hypothetical protein E3J35_09525 [Methanomassiliicoccales archaeon]|nr:MAG: hypothetical protein E3J35_09525 [Methanomassiliicoccales archaeon]
MRRVARVRRLGKKEFSLRDLYAFEEELREEVLEQVSSSQFYGVHIFLVAGVNGHMYFKGR